jgi:hypothetical protein
MKMEKTQCSKTSAIKHHTPGNNPKDYTQHLEHGESLKSRIIPVLFPNFYLLFCPNIRSFMITPITVADFSCQEITDIECLELCA